MMADRRPAARDGRGRARDRRRACPGSAPWTRCWRRGIPRRIRAGQRRERRERGATSPPRARQPRRAARARSWCSTPSASFRRTRAARSGSSICTRRCPDTPMSRCSIWASRAARRSCASSARTIARYGFRPDERFQAADAALHRAAADSRSRTSRRCCTRTRSRCSRPRMKELMATSDVVVASHVYLAPLIARHWKGELWYDAHNVEADMKADILGVDRVRRRRFPTRTADATAADRDVGGRGVRAWPASRAPKARWCARRRACSPPASEDAERFAALYGRAAAVDRARAERRVPAGRSVARSRPARAAQGVARLRRPSGRAVRRQRSRPQPRCGRHPASTPPAPAPTGRSGWPAASATTRALRDAPRQCLCRRRRFARRS